MPEGFLWIRQAFIDRALLPLSPPIELSLNNLKRALAYIKIRWPSPTISYETWLRVAYKISIPDDLAWVYYTAYLSVEYEPFSQYQKGSKALQLDATSSLQPIPILPFMVVLFCQEISKINLRSSYNTGDLWPSQESPETQFDDESERRLINHLHTGGLKDLLEILSVYDQEVADYKSPVSNANQIKLSTASLALSLLFDCSPTKQAKVIWPFDEFLRRNQSLIAIESSENSDTFLRSQDLIKLVLNCLVRDPFKPIMKLPGTASSSCASSSSSVSTHSVAKTVSNHKSAPSSHRLVVLSNYKGRTTAKDTFAFEGSSVRIHRCRDSNIYLLKPLKDAILQDCRDCQVILGPVANTVKLLRCHNVTVISVCWRLLVIDSTACHFAVKCSSRPVLLGPKNADLLFGPFNSTYGWLGEDLLKAKLDFSKVNADWTKPVSLTSEKSGKVVPYSCWSLQSPKDFEVFVIPFIKSVSPVEVESNEAKEAREAAVSIPEEFADVILAKRGKFAEWQAKASQMDQLALSQLLSQVQSAFETFIRQQDEFHEIKQLDQLVPRFSGIPPQ